MGTINQPTKKAKETETKRKKPKIEQIRPDVHKQVLNFLNEAVRAEDLMYGKPITAHVHPTDEHPEHHDHDHERHEIIKSKFAKQIIAFKDSKYPLGLRNWRELLEIERFRPEWLDDLVLSFSPAVIGQWDEFPQDIPRRGDGTRDGVVHAILLKTGKVLFITADETTLLWNPEDLTPATFENPANQPHTMPNGYSQICGHHVQLSDEVGSILSVGGGGYGPRSTAIAGYIFNPSTKTWRRSANDMTSDKWYPTAVSLGGKKVLVVGGAQNVPTPDGTGDIEIFDETTETFQPISGDSMKFPNLYPGLHILPNNAIFYSRTGFSDAGGDPGGISYDDPTVNPNDLGGKRSAYFTLNSSKTGGTWQKITPSPVNRTKGMSVTLIKSTPPYVRIIVVGGGDNTTNDTYEILDASVLSPTSSFTVPQPVPDGENRILCSGVVLPDGNLFVCGGIQRTNSPCTMFNSQSNSWSAMASLPSVRAYHSTAILLPSGKVMMAGWHNAKIEIFSPPYIFKGPRPEISSAPTLVHHGADFTIESPDADTITKVVFVRPMAVTHQTDSEQRVIELHPFIHDHMNPTQIQLTAPDGGHPHPLAPRGNYMMFAINTMGVPSVAKWIYLH